jgi:hypothetical protein
VNRRTFLAGLASGVAGGLAGCRYSASGGSTPAADGATDDDTPTPQSTATAGSDTLTATETSGDAPTLAETGSPADICEASITEDFSIVEIAEPAFGVDWSGYDVDARYLRGGSDGRLVAAATVVGRVHDGHARAYPVSVLWHHEIVNDTHGVPLIVTFCSICRTGLVARRVVEGEVTRFGVSGQLWRPPDRYISASAESGATFGADRWEGATTVRDGANLVMYDELTRSFWSQGVARAICGPAAGTDMEIVPSTVTTWGEWRVDHPDGEVLLPPPHSTLGVD